MVLPLYTFHTVGGRASRSMLDTEINIRKGLNEVGCIASKEALKYLDTDGSLLKIGEELWKSKGEQPKEYQTPYGEIIVNCHVISVQ